MCTTQITNDEIDVIAKAMKPKIFEIEWGVDTKYLLIGEYENRTYK
jgi:hypothetical protein